jgi:hypothetical protein
MSTAQKLRAEGEARGEAKGEARGEARGEVIGKLRLLEQLMGLPVSDAGELRRLELPALEAQFSALERQYGERFKR